MKSARLISSVWLSCCIVALASPLAADDSSSESRDAERRTASTLQVYAGQVQEVIYGRKHGVALTMDIFTPDKPNAAGCILVVSGGWVSHRGRLNHPLFRAIIDAFFEGGYTVFAVVHGSQPKYTIPEILDDLHRAVRYVRHHATEYGVHPDRLGITGGSAGGHLSLMQGVASQPGNPAAEDPVDQETSRVQVVGCFFPPTDFLNYGKPGEIALGRGLLKNYRAPFDFREFDQESRSYVTVTDVMQLLEIGRQISPISHVTPDDPPTLIIHGEADRLVPIQQSQAFMDKLIEAGITGQLITKQGAGHGWPNISAEVAKVVQWFDTHLGQE